MGCQWQSSPTVEEDESLIVSVERFDRVESLYLTMADYAALSQMRTDYPMQTRTLIEDVLQLGAVNDSDINTRMLVYFQDSTLQALIADVERQYADISDINHQLSKAFERLSRLIDGLELPQVYTQISSLDQSIVVADSLLGISLDKYLGADYPAYLRYGYTEQQRRTMTRQYIVPDCLCFYLLSKYPLSDEMMQSDELRRQHMNRIQRLANQALGRRFFDVD